MIRENIENCYVCYNIGILGKLGLNYNEKYEGWIVNLLYVYLFKI